MQWYNWCYLYSSIVLFSSSQIFHTHLHKTIPISLNLCPPDCTIQTCMCSSAWTIIEDWFRKHAFCSREFIVMRLFFKTRCPKSIGFSIRMQPWLKNRLFSIINFWLAYYAGKYQKNYKNPILIISMRYPSRCFGGWCKENILYWVHAS